MHTEDRDRQSRIESLLAARMDRTERGITPRGLGPAPLTHVQESLWLAWKLSEGSAANNRPTAFRVTGPLDHDALAVALRDITERHEILRSTFPLVGESPHQIAHPVQDIDLPLVDLSTMNDPLGTALTTARRHIEVPFDLERDVPFRPLLLKLAEDDHLLVIRLHHVVLDGWSEQILAVELADRYHEQATKAARPVVPVSVQYADYAAWQRGNDSEPQLDRQLAHWREVLDPLPHDLELPADIIPPSETTALPVELELGEQLAADIDAFARRSGGTTFMVLLAGVQVLLARLTREREFLIGVATAGRDHPATEQLIGCFINTVLVRASLDDHTSFADLVDSTRREALRALANQDLPYSRVVQEVRPWASGDHRPLYNVHMQMRDFPPTGSIPGDVRIEPFALPERGGGTQLSIRAAHVDGRIVIRIGFDASRFSSKTIEAWAHHLRAVLEHGVADPSRTVWDLPMISDDERRRLLVDFNEPTRTEPSTGPLPHHRFREYAAAHPDAIAYVAGDREISYGTLDRWVGAIASYLIETGASGHTVAVFLPRGPYAVASILGVLTAGAAFVPIDPEMAGGWLGSITIDADPALVITDASNVEQISVLGRDAVIVEDLILRPEMPKFDVEIADESLAYVMFTSGSTGAPKGVMIEHRQLAEYVDRYAEIYQMGPTTRALQIYTLAFDGSFNNYLTPLSRGGTVVLRDETAEGSMERFFRFCDRHRLTHLSIPTSFFHEMASELEKTDLRLPPTIRFVGFGGEAVRADAVRAWQKHVGDSVRTFNGYGPTETTVAILAKEITSSTPFPHRIVPVGRPPDNVRVYILDERGQPVPVGVPGELYASGMQVSRGYLNRLDETAARFLPDPFSPGDRMYRTGDLCLWLDDGDVVFLSRVDRQVKVRGFRIELPAIEYALRQHPAVDDAAVIARPGPGGVNRLLGYVVSSNGFDLEDLTSHLRSLLPDYMVPAAITQVDRFPRTASRKLDEKALPEPRIGVVSTPRSEAPRGVAEIVASTWREVLEIDTVPSGASFFELGGHSLLAIRLMSRIRDRTGADLPLSALFTHATIEEFTELVEERADTAFIPPTQSTVSGADAAADDALAAILAEIDQLSDEEAEALLAALEAEEGES